MKITNVKKLEETDKVYDIQVQDVHNYILENGVVSHNSGPIFAASQVVALGKLKLKEDDQGNKISDVTGIRAKIKVVKSRFSKPFEEVSVKIPYSTGMDPYSGLFELFYKKGVITKPSGNKYIYVDKEGTEHKYFEKEYQRNMNNVLDTIMAEWNEVDVMMGEVEEEDDE